MDKKITDVTFADRGHFPSYLKKMVITFVDPLTH